MRYQTKEYTCGPAAVVNALKCLGKRVSEKKIIALSGTTRSFGTDEHGIIKAIRELGFEDDVISTNSKTEAWDWLHDCVNEGSPVIICVDAWSHWATVIGSIGDAMILFDPGRTKKNKVENGTHIISKKDLLKRWTNDREKHIYGISVFKKGQSPR